MGKSNPLYPARVIVIVIALLFGILNVCQIYSLEDTYPVAKILIGSDYLCFYSATKNLLLKGNPYDKSWYSSTIDDYAKPLARYAYNPTIPWYCFPPVAASLNYPLSYLEIETAAKLMFFILIAAFMMAYGLITVSFDFKNKSEWRRILLYGFVIIMLSYPFYFLVSRGHMIGITFLLIAAGTYLYKKNNPISGVCFGVATGMFLFPGLIILPLLLFRRYKITIYMAVTLIVLVLCCPDLWWFFLKNILMLRVDTHDILHQNCSLAAVFFNSSLVFERIASLAGLHVSISRYYTSIALVVYGLLLFVMVFCDYKIRKKYHPLGKDFETTLLLMYLPFMIAVPKATFPYNLVLLLLIIPAMCSLGVVLKESLPPSVFGLLTCGIALSQFQAQISDILLRKESFSFHFFSAFGLLLVMIGCVVFKVWFWKTGNLSKQMETVGR